MCKLLVTLCIISGLVHLFVLELGTGQDRTDGQTECYTQIILIVLKLLRGPHIVSAIRTVQRL